MDSGIFTLLLTDGTQGLERCVNRKVIIIFCPIVYFIEPWRYRSTSRHTMVENTLMEHFLEESALLDG